MTHNNDLNDRLDDLEETVVGVDDRPGWGITIVYEIDDGYETADGDAIPTTDDGTPDIPGDGLMIILDGEYAL